MRFPGFLLFLTTIAFMNVKAQAPLAGIVNEYRPVMAINTCTNVIRVSFGGDFAIGDRVLLIQMKGADIDQSNTASYGSITSLNGAGHYELNTIDTISINDIRLKYKLSRNYDVNGKVQLVKVASYQAANVFATVYCRPWDGLAGGVVVIEADTLYLNADIDATGKGFHGGDTVNSGSSCVLGGFNGYYTSRSSKYGGLKGEGIAEYKSGQEAGRGPLATGGGGGNDHNSGGGGGGNYFSGGQGGERIKGFFSCPGPYPGKGGKGTGFFPGDRLFLGGGGGGGQGNNMKAGRGGNGGGIILIVARIIRNPNGFMLKAGGETGGLGSQDGAGGGGASGTILVFTETADKLLIDLNGGNGGDNDNDQVSDCCGPAGGGGTGVFILRYKGSIPNMVLNTVAGVAGKTTNAASPCFGSSNNAADGNYLFSNYMHMNQDNLYDDSIPFVPQDFAQINTGRFASVCSGDSLFLQASGGNSYVWSPAAGLSDPNAAATYAKPLADIVYTVTVSLSAGCTDTETVNIKVVQPPFVDAGPDSSICPGESVRLNGTGTGLVSWFPAGSLDNSSILDPVATPIKTTDYVLTVSNGACSSSDSVTLVVKPAVNADAGPDRLICKGDSTQLQAGGGINYQWSPAAGLSNASIAAPLASPATNTAYTVVVSDGKCSDTDIVLVEVVNAVTSHAGNDTSICIGNSVLLSGSANNTGWHWNTGDSSRSILVSPASTTVYTLQEKNGTCTGNTDSVIVFVLPKPTAAFLSDKTSGNVPLNVKFSSQGNGNSYLWNFGNQAVSTEKDPEYKFIQPGSYVVKLIIKNNEGCLDSSELTINITDSFFVFVPNIFTPGNDGFNDVLRMQASGFRNVSAVIYNRWGQEVRRFTDDLEWDGKINGTDAASGVYYYVISAADFNERLHQYHGSITLVR